MYVFQLSFSHSPKRSACRSRSRQHTSAESPAILAAPSWAPKRHRPPPSGHQRGEPRAAEEHASQHRSPSQNNLNKCLFDLKRGYTHIQPNCKHPTCLHTPSRSFCLFHLPNGPKHNINPPQKECKHLNKHLNNNLQIKATPQPKS